MRKVAWPAIAVLALLGVAGAAHTSTTSLAIANESTMPMGGLARVTPAASAIFVPRGQTQVEAGIEEFRIDLAQPRFGDAIEVHIFLLNPLELPRSLSSPANYLEVAIWHPDPDGTHTLADGTHVRKDPDLAAVGRITEAEGNVVLLPSVAGASRMHVLASVLSTTGRAASQQDVELIRLGIEVRT